MGPETVQLRILKDLLHPTLENTPDAQNAQCTPYAPGTSKSTRENFGKPAKSFSDFICKDTIAPGLVVCQLENVEL